MKKGLVVASVLDAVGITTKQLDLVEKIMALEENDPSRIHSIRNFSGKI